MIPNQTERYQGDCPPPRAYCPPQVSEHFGTLRIEDAFHRSFSDRDFEAGVISEHFGAAFGRKNDP